MSKKSQTNTCVQMAQMNKYRELQQIKKYIHVWLFSIHVLARLGSVGLGWTRRVSPTRLGFHHNKQGHRLEGVFN